MILTVTPNPCVDKTLFYESVELGGRLRAEKCTCVPGGKGNNVSRAVKALGYDTAAMPIVGGSAGQHVVNMIVHDDEVRCIPVWVGGMTRTITTVLEESIHRQTAFFEPGPAVAEAEYVHIRETFRDHITEAKVVTFNGTVPHPMLLPLYRDLIRIAKEAGVITILDSHSEEFALGLESEPDMIKPNTEEAANFFHCDLETDAARWQAAGRFHEKGVDLVVMSLGADGALVSRRGERFHAVPPRIEEINPVGSGDALVAGFAIGLQEGWNLERMARLGIAAGTANAMSWDIGHFTADTVNEVGEKVRIERK
jgi:tagatose 6-phosphate kinase